MSTAPSRRTPYVAEWLFVGPRSVLAEAAPHTAVTTPSQPVQRRSFAHLNQRQPPRVGETPDAASS